MEPEPEKKPPERITLWAHLTAYGCPVCRKTGAKVYRTVGRIRYVHCNACGAPGKVVF